MNAPCKSIAVVAFALLTPLPAYAGYTHYFTWRQKPDEAALRNCIAEMRLIIEEKSDILAGPGAEGAPMTGELEVRFNGRGDNAYELFVFPGPPEFNFCKTQWRPYDAVVVACLLVARDHFPPDVLKIASDGQWRDWADGAALYERVLRRPARNPLGTTGVGLAPRWLILGLMLIGLVVVWLFLKRRPQARERA